MNKRLRKSSRIICVVLALIFIVLLLPSCSFSMGSSSEKDYGQDIENIIKNAKLQYPKTNEDYYYNVYDSYIKITKYIGDKEVVIVPSKIDELPVYVIGDEAFEGASVKDIQISEGIYQIGASCFADCALLETVDMPESVTLVGDSAFDSCTSLKEIVFPENVSEISSSVCYQCSSLTSVKILATGPDSEINRSAFEYCESLETVYISEAVTSIASSAFSGIPETVVFSGCSGSAAAEYCAEHFYRYEVADIPEVTEEPTSEEIETEADGGSDSNAIVTLIIIAVVFVGLVAGTVVFVIIKQRRR